MRIRHIIGPQGGPATKEEHPDASAAGELLYIIGSERIALWSRSLDVGRGAGKGWGLLRQLPEDVPASEF